jgi:hypothetical protein
MCIRMCSLCPFEALTSAWMILIRSTSWTSADLAFAPYAHEHRSTAMHMKDADKCSSLTCLSALRSKSEVIYDVPRWT